jgi:hypothetical protein
MILNITTYRIYKILINTCGAVSIKSLDYNYRYKTNVQKNVVK